MIFRILLIAFALLASAGAKGENLPRIAVFDLELLDTSLQGALRGTSPNETSRLQKIGDQLREKLAQSGRFQVVDISPVEKEAQASNLQACGGCDVDLARKVGANLALTGLVQKVSELIISITLYIRDVETGKVVASMSADARGNTDEAWSRTMNWLIKNRLLVLNL